MPGTGGAIPTLLGDRALVARDREAFAALAMPVTVFAGDATVQGLTIIAKSLGWL